MRDVDDETDAGGGPDAPMETAPFPRTETLPILDDADESGARRLEPTLYVVDHPDPSQLGARAVLHFGEPLLVGRGGHAFGPDALRLGTISRRHVEITRGHGGVELRDLGSRNGTRVNGIRVSAQELEDGDLIQAGALVLMLGRAPAVYHRPDNPRVVGVSWRIREILDQVAAVAPRDTHLVLLGETGTGKELIAREVHASSRREGRFVAVNCGSIGEGVLQSELFGHLRGAFSGAQRDRAGLVEEARGGTLFLDEIGDASPAMQVALLRLLQEGEYRRVGSDRVHHADVRVIAATHRDLRTAVAQERFRADLWMRLSRWVLELPPLRERREDIPPLAACFVRRFSDVPMRLSTRLLATLLRHDWPGNVRELESVIERVVIEGRGRDVLSTPKWMSAGISGGDADDRTMEMALDAGAPRPTSARRARPKPAELGALLRQVGGNMRRLARELGVSRSTVYRWFEEAGIDPATLRD